jgi:two-component system OmpR family response regulator
VAKILIVEDALDVADSMLEWLTFHEFVVNACHDGNRAVELLHKNTYDLVILDLGLPGIDGVDLLRALRNDGDPIPVLVVSGRTAIESKTACLDLGADDYLTKPFHFKELVSRVRALLRRRSGYAFDVLQVGDISVNWTTKKVMVEEQEIKLTPQEFALLKFFGLHPNCTFSSHELLTRVWESGDSLSDSTVRTCVKRLRQKLSEFGSVDPIETLAGGYRLNVQDGAG